jgi:hypothetical protein
MKAFVKGPVSIIEIKETDSDYCETTCPFMDENADGTIYCSLFSEDLEGTDDDEEYVTDYKRTIDCIKSEIKTQFDEEGNLI